MNSTTRGSPCSAKTYQTGPCLNSCEIYLIGPICQESSERGTWFWTDDYRPENSVLHAMAPETPEKLALAKMRMLKRRGLIHGCTCGCRGDFGLTGKGLAKLNEA